MNINFDFVHNLAYLLTYALPGNSAKNACWRLPASPLGCVLLGGNARRHQFGAGIS